MQPQANHRRLQPVRHTEDSTPADERAERIVLGCILGAHCYDEVSALLSAEDFYDSCNRAIYEAMSKLAADNQPPADKVLLLNQLLAMQREDPERMQCFAPDVEVSFLDYARKMEREALQVFPVPFPREYAESIFEKAQLRRFLNAAETAAIEARGRGRLDWRALLARVERSIAELAGKDHSEPRIDPEQIARDLLAGTALTPWIVTGFRDLDDSLLLRAGDLLVLAADTSQGKTTFACQIAVNVAEAELKAAGALSEHESAAGERPPRGVLYLSLEQSADRLMQRIIAAEARVPLALGYRYTAKESERVEAAGAGFKALPFRIVHHARLTADDIIARAKATRVRAGNLALIVVDYIQLVGAGEGAERWTRERVISEASHALKSLACELGCVVLCLSQFNRDHQRRQDKPRLSDLRDSGAIEQDADAVLLLYAKDDRNSGRKIVEIAKNRDGSAGEISLIHTPVFVRFDDAPAAS